MLDENGLTNEPEQLLKEKLENQKKRRTNNNKFSYYLIAIYFGLYNISELAVSFYLKDEIKLEPAVLTQIMSLVMVPWMVKPFLGLLTDLLPIFGYRRKYYLLICGMLVITCWLVMAAGVTKLTNIILLLFLINTGVSFSTVIGEAIVVELSQKEQHYNSDEKQNSAKDNVSVFMLFKYSGYLTSSYLKGLLVEVLSIRGVFMIVAFLPILLLISSYILVDKRVVKYGEIQSNYEYNESREETIKSPDSSKLLSEFFKFMCKRYVLVPSLFILFVLSLPAYDTPYFYFLTNVLNFSPSTLGKISFGSTLATLISIILYKLYFKNVKFKLMIALGTILTFIFTILANILVLRINIRYGISDFWLVMFSSSFISMLGELMLMPMLSLAAELCPKNLEGTVYSLFMSTINLGSISANLFGSI